MTGFAYAKSTNLKAGLICFKEVLKSSMEPATNVITGTMLKINPAVSNGGRFVFDNRKIATSPARFDIAGNAELIADFCVANKMG